MELTPTKNIIEAALLAANGSLSFDRLVELFSVKGVEVDRAALREALSALANDYTDRQIELKETASGFRIQAKSAVREWLQPLFEERAPRYTRALLETLALVAYRQPITRAEIEDVRGVAVSTNIIRTLLERSWVKVVGHRDVPGKPEMLGTTREFLDYFGLKKLDDLPPLSALRDIGPENSPQSDFVDDLAAVIRETDGVAVGDAPESDVDSESPAVEAAADETGADAPSADDATADEPAADEPAPNVVPIQQSEA